MTVEELINELQKVENKKSCVKVAVNTYGCLKYEPIQAIRIADKKEKKEVIKQQNLRYYTDNGYVVIECGGRGE